MPLELNLEKAKPALKLSLEKAGIFKLPSIDCASVMDVSQSFDDEHRNGLTNDITTRLVPYGLLLDPDGKLDGFTFSDGPNHAHYVGPITESNYQTYVSKQIIGRVPGYNGLTDYSFVLELVVKHFGWTGAAVKKAGFFGRMMGKKDEVVEKKRSIIFFKTDGAPDHQDIPRTRRVLDGIRDRGDLVYVLFMGINSNPAARFSFLEQLAGEYDFVGYRRVTDIPAFVGKSDEDMNDFIFDKELTDWLKKTA